MLLTALCSPVSAAETYAAGKLIAVASGEGGSSKVYRLCIQQGDHFFNVKLENLPKDMLEWQLNQEIEFRVHGNHVYLRRHGGEDITTYLAEEPWSDRPGFSELQDLPFPPAGLNDSTAPMAVDRSYAPRCVDLAAAGPGFKLLANACQVALSPNYLPNFICQETVQRFRGGAVYQYLEATGYARSRGDVD